MTKLSATSRRIQDAQEYTFPINDTHSEIVKFTKGSQDLNVVVSKVDSILGIPRSGQIGAKEVISSESNIETIKQPESSARTGSNPAEGRLIDGISDPSC